MPHRTRASSNAVDLDVPSPRLMRLAARAAIVCMYRALIFIEKHEHQAAKRAGDGTRFRASIASVRRWSRRFDRAGFLGLASVQFGRKPPKLKR
jgi:hypothetical protein